MKCSAHITHELLLNLNAVCFAPLDRYFATFIVNDNPHPESQWLYAAAALVSRCRDEGHACWDLQQTDPSRLTGENPAIPPITAKDWPTPQTWRDRLQNFPEMIGKPGELKPLILDQRLRLYLYRYWRMEQNLVERLAILKPFTGLQPEAAHLTQCVAECFPHSPDVDPAPWRAAINAIYYPISVISGGPGTGKTTTIAKVLHFFHSLFTPAKLRIGITALTGKAAHRLQEAIAHYDASLPEARQINPGQIPAAITVHKLLGFDPRHNRFRHHRDNLLPYDLIIVDEASMIDLLLMDKLLAALPLTARLILVGDKDQLASVAPGAVFSDLCQGYDPGADSPMELASPLPVIPGADSQADNVKSMPPARGYGFTLLTRSYRFPVTGGIARLSQLVLAGDADNAWRLLSESTPDRESDIHYCRLPLPGEFFAVFKALLPDIDAYLNAVDKEDVFRLFNRSKILSPFRVGPYGTAALNTAMEQFLQENKRISGRGKWYPGRPLIITRNDYRAHLFNGDIGIVLREASDQQLYAFFAPSDPSWRRYQLAHLPEHDTCYALTVNKAQGSEYSSIHFLIPDGQNQILTRELLYTGITRARNHLTIYTNEMAFKQALENRTIRSSGLSDRLSEERLPSESQRP